jgi:hypothetical protein
MTIAMKVTNEKNITPLFNLLPKFDRININSSRAIKKEPTKMILRLLLDKLSTSLGIYFNKFYNKFH